ncbi:hypothetical protein [Variovorax terrae]|uniref:Transmembrane protein n=1 Tax=Variovorax terrae TaxID=2923278 RepID=A0A9X1VX42_9BURK|nr:hypothetical protein [Variovorax terrae]MCJ0764595.1 hypothetical protein [Variovorax terrae]
MHRPFTAAVLGASLLLAACHPTFNWREVRADPAGLTVLLPCKPDEGARRVPFGDREVELRMLGCDAGGATFAVAYTDAGDAGQVVGALALWKAATLANMRAAGAPSEAAAEIKGADGWPAPVRVSAAGRRADGSAVTAQIVWFARGTRIFQAVMYADKPEPEAAETFFSGISLS